MRIRFSQYVVPLTIGLAIVVGSLSVQAQDVFSSNSNANTNTDPCQAAYNEGIEKVSEENTLLDAEHKKGDMDCAQQSSLGRAACLKALGEKIESEQLAINKQLVDIQAQRLVCEERAGLAKRAGNGQPANPGTPQNPLKGYVTNLPQPPDEGVQVPPQSPTQNLSGIGGGVTSAAAVTPAGHSPLFYLNNALNDATSRIPNGSQNVQQAGQAAAQVDKTVNTALNNGAQKMKAVRDSMANEMVKKWTHPMSPKDAVEEVGTAYAGSVVGAGIGAAGGTLLKGGANGAWSAGAKAAAKEGNVIGLRSATAAGTGALAARVTTSPGEGVGGEQPGQPANVGQSAQQQPPPSSQPVDQPQQVLASTGSAGAPGNTGGSTNTGGASGGGGSGLSGAGNTGGGSGGPNEPGSGPAPHEDPFVPPRPTIKPTVKPDGFGGYKAYWGTDPIAFAMFRPENGGAIVSDLFRGAQPRASGGIMLADALRSAAIRQPNSITFSNIIEDRTLDELKSGMAPAQTLLGKTLRNASTDLGAQTGNWTTGVTRGHPWMKADLSYK